MATKTKDRSSQPLVEFYDSRGATLRVDREKGVIYGVKILGHESANGRSYSPKAIREAAKLYEGSKVNLNHARGANATGPRGYEERLGAVRGVTVVEGSGLFGNLHYNPKHAIAEQLIWDAENAPENVGLSHSIEGRTGKKDGRTVVEQITKVISVDLVADPATNKSLFEHLEPEGDDVDLKALTIAEIIAARPDLKTQILEEARGADAESEKDAKLAKLQEQIDSLTAEKTLAARKAIVASKLDEAKLPKHFVTDLFREQCEAADDAQLARLIEDRKVMAGATPAPTQRYTAPASKDQTKLEESAETFTEVKDDESFVRALCR